MRVGGGLLCTAAVVAAPAQAANWYIEPSIRVQETYSTNPTSSANDEKAGFVTEVTPGVHVTGKGGRLFVDLDYSPNAVFYTSDSDSNRLDHRLNSRATLEAIDNFFYVDAKANVSQQFLSPNGSRPTNTSTATDNRYTASTLSLSPYIRGYMGYNEYLLSNESEWVDTGQVSNLSNDLSGYTNRTTARFNTPIPTFGLSLEYDGRKTEYDDGQEVETQAGRVIVHYRLDNELLVSLRTGYEKDDYGSVKEEGDFYGIGVKWNPSPRTSFDGYYEDHYYGGSYQAAMSYRFRRAMLKLSASRGIQTFEDNLRASQDVALGDVIEAYVLANFPSLRNDPALLEAAKRLFLAGRDPNSLLQNSSTLFSEQAQIVERLDAALIVEGARNTLTFRLYVNQTEAAASGEALEVFAGTDLPADTFATADHVNEVGAQISWVHKLTPLMNLGVTFTHTMSETKGVNLGTTENVETTEDSLAVRLSKKLGAKTNGFTGLRYTTSDSDGAGSEYDETAIFAGLDHRF